MRANDVKPTEPAASLLEFEMEEDLTHYGDMLDNRRVLYGEFS